VENLLVGPLSLLPLKGQKKAGSTNKTNNSKTHQIFNCSIKQLDTSTTPLIRLERKGTRILIKYNNKLKVIRPRGTKV
jgi:hypothetical protein